VKTATLVAVLLFSVGAIGQEKPADSPKDAQQQPAPDAQKASEPPKHRIVSAPRAIYTRDPEYTNEAREKRIEGTVIVSVVVDEKGRVSQAKIKQSLGYGLDQKAIEAAKSWRFEPAKADGKPVSAQINIQMNFKLYP
jgi:TonB family protein